MGNEAQAEQAGTEQCQGPRFRNRVANRVHTPQTNRRELQGKHKIIEVVIGPWPQVFPTEIAAADKRTVRAHEAGAAAPEGAAARPGGGLCHPSGGGAGGRGGGGVRWLSRPGGAGRGGGGGGGGGAAGQVEIGKSVGAGEVS